MNNYTNLSSNVVPTGLFSKAFMRFYNGYIFNYSNYGSSFVR